MRDHPKKKGPKKKSRRGKAGGVHAIRVPIEKSPKTTLRDVELAIERKLAGQRTELFTSDDTIVIVVEKEGH